MEYIDYYGLDFFKQNAEFTHEENLLVDENVFIERKKCPEDVPAVTFEDAKDSLPVPHWEGHEDYINCYWKAWEIGFKNVLKLVPNTGFVSNFIDTAFNGCIFMWDSSFMLMFGKYANRIFKFQKTLDNFYSHQHIDGFICPGHVAVILGEKGFEYLPLELKLPGAIAGFEAEDILLAVYKILKRIKDKRPGIDNCYPRAVSREGNLLAQETVESCFEPRRDLWRGLGAIDASGLGFKAEYELFDAEKRFDIVYAETETPTACRCGDVICGRIPPRLCPMFGKLCTPEDPVGPCMVSSEGACAAAYKYSGI